MSEASPRFFFHRVQGRSRGAAGAGRAGGEGCARERGGAEAPLRLAQGLSGARAGGAQSQARAEGRVAAAAGSADELARAGARIAELERIIGRQQADLHFFREALRLWDATNRSGGAPTSTRSSKK